MEEIKNMNFFKKKNSQTNSKLTKPDIEKLLQDVYKRQIHDAAAVRTEQYAGEQTHFIIAVGAFALLAKLLHPFPCLGRCV